MRRNRRDLQSRDYLCPCGKAYLSYPALHTHIKKYHDSEENMLENAIMPQRTGLKRGRPNRKQIEHADQELEELTLLQTSILKIYEQLSGVIKSPIMLEGNLEIDTQEQQSKYRVLLRQSAHLYHFASQREVKESEAIIKPIADGLVRHFVVEISTRIRLMLLIGYLHQRFNSSQKEVCLARMRQCGWEEARDGVVELVFNVLMQVFQRRGHSELLVTSREE